MYPKSTSRASEGVKYSPYFPVTEAALLPKVQKIENNRQSKNDHDGRPNKSNEQHQQTVEEAMILGRLTFLATEG